MSAERRAQSAESCRADGWQADVRLEPTRDVAYMEALAGVPLGHYVAQPANVFLRVTHAGADGGFAGFIREQDQYVGHLTFTPACRGLAAAVALRDAVRWLWRHTTAAAVAGRVWDDRPEVACLARWCGFVKANPIDLKGRNGHRYTGWYYRRERSEACLG